MKLPSTFSVKSLLIVAVGILIAGSAQARDDKYTFPIADVLSMYEDRLDSDIALYFGEQAHPPVAEEHGQFPTNKKTNAFGKSDEEACRWVMLSALLSLQERAKMEGGNAVVNIRSYYKKDIVSSEEKYECHAGAVIAGVAFIGDVVTLNPAE